MQSSELSSSSLVLVKQGTGDGFKDMSIAEARRKTEIHKDTRLELNDSQLVHIQFWSQH